MLSLLLGAVCFAGIHLGVAGTTLRDRAIAARGEGAYHAVFSIVSLAAIVWLVMAYKDAPYVATWGCGTAVFDDAVSMHMTAEVITTSEDERVHVAMEKITNGRFRHLPVIRHERLVGLAAGTAEDAGFR